MCLLCSQEKYIIPEKGKKYVFAVVNDAWRRYKHLLKKNHFTKYKTMRERLKNRPEEVPEEDFKKLLVYWRDENSQVRYNYYFVYTIVVAHLEFNKIIIL